MRILLVSDDPRDPRLGVARVALRLQREFEALGHTCDALFQPELGRHPCNPRMRCLMEPRLARNAVRQAIRARGPYDVIDAAGAAAALLRDVPPRRFDGNASSPALIVRSHGLEHLYYKELLADGRAGLLHKPWTHRLWYPYARLRPVATAYRGADAAIVLNPNERSYVAARGWLPESRIHVVAHGVDGAAASAPSAAGARGAGALFCGFWYTAKGVHYLARAHQQLLEHGLAMPITILGAGIDEPLAALRQRVETTFATACRPLLTVHARMDEARVTEQFRRHDLLVSSSTMEGCSLTILEAMNQRLPVVCTAVGAVPMLVDRRTAVVVAPRDANALAEAMAGLWLSAQRRHTLAESAYRWVQQFTWRRAAQATLAVYEGCLCPEWRQSPAVPS